MIDIKVKSVMSRFASLFRRIPAKARFIVGKLLHRLGYFRRTSTPNIFFTMDYFDQDYYFEHNSDVKISSITAFDHYMNFGYMEGRQARLFDNQWYLNKYPDIKLGGSNGFAHYINHGKSEGRLARYIVIIPEKADSERTNYPAWLKMHGSFLEAQSSDIEPGPKISILMCTYNSDEVFLKAALDSVLAQTYQNWELCIADDASTKLHVKSLLEEYASRHERIKLVFRDNNGHISEASNSALELCTGSYIGLLDHDDLLTSDALNWVAKTLTDHPDADLVYSDEDKVDEQDNRFDPYFKSDFNYELLLAQNMISHFGVYRASLLKSVGGFRPGYEGAQDHDLALRIVEASEPSRIVHIPRVLYHWRAATGSTALAIGEKSYATHAGLRAVSDHLKRLQVKAMVQLAGHGSGHYRVRYALLQPQAQVSIIIPTRDRADILKVCIDSILKLSRYKNFEIIIIDNGSVETETMAFFSKLPADKVKIIRHDAPFNYSELNNIGASHASGEYLCLLNNDIEITTPDWIEELLSFAQRPDIGCVGARLWYPDKTLQHGGVILGIGGVAGHAHKQLDSRSTGYFCRAIHHQSLSAVTAACLMIRKTTYLAVGGLDTQLAVAFNDVDFCLRVREAGYRNIWTPYAEMIHYESASRGSEITPLQQERFNREVAFMLERWGDKLLNDPAYNPNLTLEFEDFSYAWPPRLMETESIRKESPIAIGQPKKHLA